MRQRRILAGLVTVQFACAVVLLAAGGLLIRSFVRLMATDPGFRTDNVISVATTLPASSYPDGASVRTFYASPARARRGQLPGVTAAGAATDLPLTVRERRAFTIENPSPSSLALSHTVANDWVMGRYFEALGVRIVRGRPLSDTDTADLGARRRRQRDAREALLARRGSRSAIGSRGAARRTTVPWMRVVGVIGDIKQAGLAAPTEPATWQPWTQIPDRMLGGNITGIFRGLKLMVRTQVPPASLVPAIRAGGPRARSGAAGDRRTDARRHRRRLGAPQRFNATLLGGFAGVALLLAAVGIGGVLAISVSRRTQEIGVRLALGARPRATVVRMVVRQGMLLVGAGLAIGLPCAFAADPAAADAAVRDRAARPVSFAAATVVLCAVALAACARPALRASRVSPVTALRID